MAWINGEWVIDEKILLADIYQTADNIVICQVENPSREYPCYVEDGYNHIKKQLDRLEKIKGKAGRIKGTKVAIKAKRNAIRKYQKRIDQILKRMNK